MYDLINKFGIYNWNFYKILILKIKKMATIAADVNKLRQTTGAGMMDCAFS
jgi:hypothetical protein